jgi:hypothetical protein
MSTAKVKYGYFPSPGTLIAMCKREAARRTEEKVHYPRGLTRYEARKEKGSWPKGVRTMHCANCGQWHLRYRERIRKPKRSAFTNTNVVLWATLARWKNNLKFARNVDHE